MHKFYIYRVLLKVVVAAYTVRLLVFDSHSLKAKRGVVKSVKERLRSRFNISVTEVGFHDKHNYVELGIAIVGVENRILEEIISKVASFLENDHRFEVVEVVKVI